jgi:Protein of unknown function (DUF3048) N-terminal domain/Protein of unknown function (DUF3048) C-terminal domain
MRIGSKLALISLLSVLALTGCTAPVLQPTASPSQTQEPEPEPVFIAAPLTGVFYEESVAGHLALPAVSAKIDNTFAGRPQLALNDADIVYVTRIEGGMTRLIPVWHSRTPETIGPVRSVRPVDAAIVHPFGGVFVYSGGQAPFKRSARDTGLVMSDEDTEQGNDTYFREKTRSAPWNLFFRAKKLQENNSDRTAPTPGFEFDASPSALLLGVEALKVTVKYPGSTSIWDLGESAFPWAASSEPAWLRTADKSEHLQEGGDRVVSKNVVVMEVEHDNSFIDPRYGAIPKAKLENNSGVAHIFTDGYYLKATWSKAGSSAPILLSNEDGTPVKLAMGNTWVEMLDQGRSKMTIVMKPEPSTTSDN